MKELLIDIDSLLAHFEDFTHGEDGKKITEMRVRIAAVTSAKETAEEAFKNYLNYLKLDAFSLGDFNVFKSQYNWQLNRKYGIGKQLMSKDGEL